MHFVNFLEQILIYRAVRSGDSYKGNSTLEIDKDPKASHRAAVILRAVLQIL
jgi:hypothetical protein